MHGSSASIVDIQGRTATGGLTLASTEPYRMIMACLGDGIDGFGPASTPNGNFAHTVATPAMCASRPEGPARRSSQRRRRQAGLRSSAGIDGLSGITEN
jgi:hypothetical protein